MAAIPIVLGGLAALGGGTLGWELYRRNAKSTPYDIIIGINSLLALKTSGWKIVLGEATKGIEPKWSEAMNNAGVVVAVLGTYNRGKSFLLNELCNIKLPSGNFTHTEGISITAPRKNIENVIFIDTAGSDAAIPKEKLDDKKATQGLLREIALHLCSYAIIVVNRLLYMDQIYIQRVLKYMKYSNDKKRIIIVHNLADITTPEDVDKVIREEIIGIFKAEETNMVPRVASRSKKLSFYRSTHDGIILRHFILAKQGSNAATKWNTQSLDGIMNIFQTDDDNRGNLDIIPKIITFVNQRLSQLLINNNQSNDGPQQPNQERLQVDQHVKQPFIVLSDRKDFENLDENPHELAISPRLTYDDAGYFIGIRSIDCGDWQPRWNAYDTPENICICIELAGFGEIKADITVAEREIIVKGRRLDLRASLNDSVVLQEEIPSGSFTLKIPLKDNVQQEEAMLQRTDGLYKITCSKRKNTVKCLE